RPDGVLEHDPAAHREVLDQVDDLQQRTGPWLRREGGGRGRGLGGHGAPTTDGAWATSSAWWQAARWLGPERARGTSAGRSVRQTSVAKGQRGLKGQPGGTRMRLGGWPTVGCNRSVRRRSRRGGRHRRPRGLGRRG